MKTASHGDHRHPKTSASMASASRTPPARPASEGTLWFEPIFALIPRAVTQVSLETGGMLYGQGQQSDGVYFVQRGIVRRSVRSRAGREATVAVVTPGGFCGEGCLSGQPFRVSSATATSTAAAVKVETAVLAKALHDSRELSEAFLARVLARSIAVEEELCGAIFTELETRRASARLQLSRFGDEAAPGEAAPLLMTISLKALAEMIGATPSRVSSVLSQFHSLGLVDYDGKSPDGEIRVHPQLLADVVLGK